MDELLEEILLAIAHGDADGALALVVAPLEVSDRLQVARAFLEAKHFAHGFHVLAGAAVLVSDEATRGRLDSLVVDTLLGWAADIEAADFPADPLAFFSRAVDACASPALRSQHLTLLIGLDEGLQRKRPVTAAFAELIRARA
ncbi:MAG: hypothetical protein K1X89_20150 [Myxococcaceae bacterium]|nr:hypothetical protein [Myxococcaceae bacterium]